MRPRSIKAVGFDLWETLITDPPEISQRQQKLRIDLLERAVATGGRPFERAAIEAAHRHVWHHCFELYWSRDLDLSSRQQVVHFVELLGLDVRQCTEAFLDTVEDAYVRPALDDPPALVEGAEETLQHLHLGGYRIGLISNTGRTPGSVLRDVLSILNLSPYIQSMVFSNEHGECKPNRSIFEKLRSQLGFAFGEIVFVGDNLYVDVHGSQQCGMRAVHFNPAVRGLAFAPAVEHGHEIRPDATIECLTELPLVVERLNARDSSGAEPVS